MYMGISKNRGISPPKWMVKIMENPIKMDDLGGNPHYFRKHPNLKRQKNTKVTVRPLGILAHRTSQDSWGVSEGERFGSL